MITWSKSNETNRGVMSCGHAIEPNSLYQYLYFSVLRGQHEIRCPYIDPSDPRVKCNQIWSYPELRKMALLDADERDFFEIQMSENKINLIKEISKCKKCENYVKRHQLTSRITCQSCIIADIQPDIHCSICKEK